MLARPTLTMTSLILLLSFFAFGRAEVLWTKRPDSDETCGTTQNHRMKRHDRVVFPRRPPSGNKYGKALEFERGQVIRYLKLRNPSKKFAIDFWMRPEGGQQNPAVVLRVFDKCSGGYDTRGWQIALREASATSNLRITFTLYSASASQNTTIMSHRKVEARRWVHVAATYDGRFMKLFVNQAKVAVGYGQKGLIFDSSKQGHACDLLEIGGDARNGFYYRGQIDKLRLWSDAISHGEITASSPDNTLDRLMEKMHMYDDFDDDNMKNVNWIPITKTHPRFVRSTVPEEKHFLSIRKPPCGVTICDNPEVIRSYVSHKAIQAHKKLKIRVVNVMDDDGTRPTVTEQEVNEQYRLIQKAFSPYNISWELRTAPIRDTWLRGKTVLHNCKAVQVGDDICNHECMYDITAMDGGDCDFRATGKCSPEKESNGVCNPECNNARNEWDGGDCCGTGSRTCFDPKSPNRAYVGMNEYKRRIGLNNKDALNVYVAKIAKLETKEVEGIATFPWDKVVHTETGGVLVPPRYFRDVNASTVLVHELGHVLGLWHVHHGSESEMKCSDDCFETFPSLELGDLCSDTGRTILNKKCAEPEPKLTSCGLSRYEGAPFHNYMGYADGSCTDHFTPQQVARMHCYIDLDYQSWQAVAKPSFVPLPPRITSASGNNVKLSWIPPLGSGGNNAKNLCNECEENKVLEQYATTAYSPIRSKPNGNAAPHQATGFPDDIQCLVNSLSWQPSFNEVVSCRDCASNLYLEVGFKEAVVPTALTIWVSWGARDAFSNIELIYTDGSLESIGNGTAQCDTPFTKPLYVTKKVSKVRIHVSGTRVGIDAVKLTSDVGHPNCSNCEPLHYIISRKPPFARGSEVRVTTTRYEDKNIDKNGRYEYRVRAVTHEGLSGPFSPTLIYKPQEGFCGDGKSDKGEECDDGNVRDGDGCNVQCQLEDVFRCAGRPSLCYRHDGDGVCEEFEKQTSIKDCGFYTPDGFKDQWVHSVTANPRLSYRCPSDVIVGEPSSDLECLKEYSHRNDGKCGKGWTPELADDDVDVSTPSNPEAEDLWIHVFFKRPSIASAVVVYLSHVSDNKNIPKLKLELVGASAQTEESKNTIEWTLSKFCKENPVTIPVTHNMTQPFFRTRYIKVTLTEDIGIAAIALRSRRHLDLVALQDCGRKELFNPRTQQCEQYKCNMPECSKPKASIKNTHKVKCKKGKQVEGDVCRVECEKGFKPVEPFEITCVGGKWLADGEPPVCKAVDCGPPHIENAEIECPKGTTFGKKCFYKCNKFTAQSGSGTDFSVTCEEDGLWSETKVFCRMTCRLPPIPLNSRALSKMCNKGKSFVAGQMCKYQCNSGFVASGFSQTNQFKKTCMKDGTWSGSRCVPVQCPADDRNIFRWYNCSLGNYFGSVCKLRCPDEKNNREVRCLAGGKWDKTFQMCQTKGTCTIPELPLTAPTMECKNGLNPGDECRMKCPEDFEPGIKAASKKTRVDSVACSPTFYWDPDPRKLKCLTKCNVNAMDDGFCDGENNNEDCDWDGGDCCDPNSVYDSDLCGQKCSCLDPHPLPRVSGNGESFSN